MPKEMKLERPRPHVVFMPLEERLKFIWASSGNCGDYTMRWLELEQTLRDVLNAYRKGEMNAYKAIRMVDDFLAAYTLRGNELPEEGNG